MDERHRAEGEVATSILHVDMDAFFAAVELLRRPELRGRPVVVGGAGDRGVVAAASYEARAFGVHSAMPAARARRLCPDAVFIRGDHAHYSEVSARVMDIFRSFTPIVEPLSLDEAFLDVSGVRRLHGAPSEIAHAIRAQVLAEEGLVCSVGVARLKFLAKLASGQAKPRAHRSGTRPGRGVLLIEPSAEREFLHPLPVKALWGVGPVTFDKLRRIGIDTVGDLASLPPDVLTAALGRAAGKHLHALANLRDDRVVEADQGVKSVSHEETFGRDVNDPDRLAVELLRMADSVASRLRSAGLRGRTVTVKVRFGDFRTITRSRTLDGPTDSARSISRTGRALLEQVDVSPGVRLLGVGVSALGEGAGGDATQLDLFADRGEVSDGIGEQDRDWDLAEATIDAIRARFGSASVGPASLAGRGGLRIARRGDQQWGPDRPEDPNQ